MNALKKKLSHSLALALKAPELSDEQILDLFDVPPDPAMGDLALACFKLSKTLRKSPVAISAELAAFLKDHPVEGVDRVESAGGYLNFFVADSYRLGILKSILASGENYGSNETGRGKTMVIDYSSPNIAKRFHIGHLGTTIIGNSIKLLHKFSGYKCVGINYLGDWGTQYGKLVVAFKHWGEEAKIRELGIKELDRLYVLFGKEAEKDPTLNDEARAEFNKLENGDEENLRLWRMFKEISLNEYMKTYELLGITFDSFNGESFYSDKMPAVVDELREKGLLKIDDGASIVDLSAYDMPPCLILKRDGSSLYPTRDIAAALWRKKEYNFDKCVYVTSAGQSLHFAQWFKVIGLMGYDWENELVHVPYGTFSINGEKIASRTGNVVLLDDLFRDAVEKAGAIIDEKNPDLEDRDKVAEAVGIGAVIFNSLLSNRIKDVNFNWEEALNFEGNTGPYAQYTYARACSILKKDPASDPIPESAALCAEEKDLISVLALFPEKVIRALNEYEPSVITRFALDLCQSFNRFYNSCPIRSASPDERTVRLGLCRAVKTVLGTALHLIGLRTPEKI
ncbi:MAG: arginine--tRNA ligase [Clostridia bacterium]|nr:arginine--tRNA ligase [Clostridia bacterium]